VAIVDYGMGNLFSVKHACESVGLTAVMTSSPEVLCSASAVILPGVGAFGDAMQALRRLQLTGPLREVAASGRPLLGICLGMQLLMTESSEFGRHRGLGLIEGDVVRLGAESDNGARRVKVPQVGWNRITPAPTAGWEGSLLEGVPDGAYMYFVHSFYVRPAEAGVALSRTRYGPTEFCSSVSLGSLFACQFHPERSGPQGLQVYRSLAARLSPHPVRCDG
jgi:glutamine amidotransferase